MTKTLLPNERSYMTGRELQASTPILGFDASKYKSLDKIGITITDRDIQRLKSVHDSYAMDAITPSVTPASNAVPVQFLQHWMTGQVVILTGALKADVLTGVSVQGAWEDNTVVQTQLELLDQLQPYGDFTNVPLSSWNATYEERTIVRFEGGYEVGILDQARASKAQLNDEANRRNAVIKGLDIKRNLIAFYGYNNGLNKTYGFLNDPGLPAYVTANAGAAGPTTWASKTFNEITKDIIQGAAALQNQSQDVIDPETIDITLALSTAVYQYLATTNTQGNLSVRQWIRETYPKMRVVSAPELNGANSGANVYYMYAETVDDGFSTDDHRVVSQIIQTKFRLLGVQQNVKTYIEDYSNASAGTMWKRPFAVYRLTGI